MKKILLLFLTLSIGSGRADSRMVQTGPYFRHLSHAAGCRHNSESPWLSWNSWMANGPYFTYSRLEQQLSVMRQLGLTNRGWTISIDDGWTAGTNADGMLYCNSNKYPYGMAAVAALIHSNGCYASLYIEPNAISSSRFPQAGAAFLTNIWQAIRTWGFDGVKFDSVNNIGGSAPNAQQTVQLLKEEREAWQTACVANTNSDFVPFETSGYFLDHIVNHVQDSAPIASWIGASLPRGPTYRTEIDIITSWTNFTQRIWRAAQNSWIVNARIASLMFNGVQINTSGYFANSNTVAAWMGMNAVLSSPIQISIFETHPSTEPFQTNFFLFGLDQAPGLSGILVESNATAAVYAKYLDDGRKLLQFIPWTTNGGTVTVPFYLLHVPRWRTMYVQDVWPSPYNAIAAPYYASRSLTVTCLPNGGATVLLTPVASHVRFPFRTQPRYFMPPFRTRPRQM